jgi:excisionase family DNA binding protein
MTDPITRPDDWIDVPEVARRTGLAQTTIREMIRAGRLRAVRLGQTDRGRFRLYWPAIEAAFSAAMRPVDLHSPLPPSPAPKE